MTETAHNNKQTIIEMIDKMPDDASFDDVMYALYVRQAIERGIADAEADRFATDEEVGRVLGKWRKSVGR